MQHIKDEFSNQEFLLILFTVNLDIFGSVYTAAASDQINE